MRRPHPNRGGARAERRYCSHGARAGARPALDRGAQGGVALGARLLLEYDGSGFAGWAAQPGVRTVRATLERALLELLRRRVELSVAGRTDAGVHARGQVASHPGEPAQLGALNALLPEDVRVLESLPAPDAFDARRDARSRVYRYRVLARPVASPFERRRALHWRRPVERDALERCAAALPGLHDFTAFTPTRSDHVRFERRVLASEWRAEGDGVLAFWIEADAFMRHMVRTLVGTMLAVAGGRMPAQRFEALLSGAPRSEAGDTAPAHGLYLEQVRY